MSSHERKLDAAEYVIGTLSQVESTAFEASIESDSKTRQDVLFWQRTFGSLSASISPEAPPEDMWKRISSALPADPKAAEAKKAEQSAKGALKPDAGPVAAAAAANDNAVLKLRRSRRRWRFGAIAASIVAIGLGSIFYNGTNGTFEERVAQIRTFGTGEGKAAGGMVAGDGKQYIAVVNANGDQPSLVINIDATTGLVSVRSVGVERPDGKSLELWYVPEGQTPVSVGLVGEGGIDLKGLTAQNGDLLAISLEPSGGSPTGTATGPVIYTGKLIENVEGQ